jgi:peptide-methionine (R)-S-oxide reductase
MEAGEIKSKVDKSNEEWKKVLSKKEYHILRKNGTEQAFTGKLLNNKKKGIYVCAGCGNILFSSDTKFDSGTGWPSFWKTATQESIEQKTDNRFGMHRIEVVCRKCGGHLGHVFDDGPAPTGKCFCINSVSLNFKEQEKPKNKMRK